MPLIKAAQYNMVIPEQDSELKDEIFQSAVPESGKIYTEMAFPESDPTQSNWVNFDKIKTRQSI